MSLGIRRVEAKWKGNWFGNEGDPQNAGKDDDLTDLYGHYGEDYVHRWKELPPEVTDNGKLGTIIFDEEVL